MANFEHRAVFKYLLKKGMSFTEIYNDMLNTLGGGCPSYTTITPSENGKMNLSVAGPA
jgi:hypothetical protein